MSEHTAWLKKVTPQIFDTLSLKEKGKIPPFPIDQFTGELRKSLQVENLSIETGKIDIIEVDHFFDGLSGRNIVIPLSFAPLEGKVYFVMGMDDVTTLISKMNPPTSTETSTLPDDESFVKGLYTYFIAEAISATAQTGTYKDLNIKMSDGSISELSAYGIDIKIHIEESNLNGRLLVPANFYKAMHAYFDSSTPSLEDLENIPDVNIPMTIHTGSTTLKRDELNNLNEGDFLILHNSFYKLSEKKGSFQMLVGDKPLFQVKTQKNGIKILDYLYFYGEEGEEMIDDEDLNSPLGGGEDDDELYDDEEWDEEDEDLEEDEFEEDDELEEELGEENTKDASAAAPAQAPIEETGFEEEKTDLVEPRKASLAEIPLTVSMEVTKFSLSLEELKKLEPGYKLPIHINPAMVNLTISGKVVGKGEVIEIGETTGVKILELYK